MENGKHIICLIFVLRIVTSQSTSVCKVQGGIGVCVNIKHCRRLRERLENQRQNATITAFLQNAKCGYEGRDPKVCCAIKGIIYPKFLDSVETSSNYEIPLEMEIPNSFNSVETSSNYETVSSPKLPSQSTCGHTNVITNRIVGGYPAELGTWPWMTSLWYRDLSGQSRTYQWLCGGALISERYVLTAAHCTVGIGNRNLAVARLGDLNLDPYVNSGAYSTDIQIERIMTHERYNAREITNDIALLKLENNATFNRFIQPICLPILSHHRSNLLVGMRPFVAGWGSSSYRGPSTNVLMQVPVPVLDNSECKQAFANNKNTVIDERVICAGYLTGGKDACQGDSGGPLMWPSGKQYYLVGVVSFGYKCAEPGYPGVYTRVSQFVEWIATNMNNS